MQLVSLSISGFKSFAKPTTLSFAPGITCVVGPNGCGKSNVVDALRWVLGEQRSSVLRGDRMENVIFNGTVNRKATGVAEVKLVLDNQGGFLNLPYTEVEIARRLYRDGTSEYLLNGNECRLKDITDVLHDSGMGPNLYTILELKMVEEILREDGDGRRAMFEEAAGVAKYKIRRRQALAKLKQTEDDLIRLSDILVEVERHVGSLKRQAIRAKKYSEYAAMLKSAESAHIWQSYCKHIAELEPLKLAIRDTGAAAETVRAALRLEEAKLADMRTSELQADQEAAGIRREHGSIVQQIATIESQTSAARAREQACKDLIDRAARERILLSNKRDMLEERKEKISRDKIVVETEISAAESSLAEATGLYNWEQEKLRAIEERALEHEQWISRTRQDLAAAQKNESSIQTTVTGKSVRRELLARDAEVNRQQFQDLAARIDGLEREELPADAVISDLRVLEANLGRKIDEYRHQVEQLNDSLRRAASHLDASRSRLELLITLEQQGPRSELSLKTLRENTVQGLTDLLGDSFEVEERFRRAFQSILGPAAYYQLANSDESVGIAAEILRRERAGQCTFISVSEFPENRNDDMAPPEGAIGTALSLVRRADAASILSHYLARVVVVENWEQAVGLRDWVKRYGATVVALDGQWISADGVYHAGSEDVRGVVDLGLARQIHDVKDSEFRSAQEQSELTAQLRAVRAAETEASQQILECRSRLEAALLKRAALREERARVEALAHSLQERSRVIAPEIDLITAELEQFGSKAEEARQQVLKAESEVESALRSGGDLNLELIDARRAANRAKDSLHETEKARDAVRHKLELSILDLETVSLNLAELEESLERTETASADAQSEIESIATLLKEFDEKLLVLWKERDRLTVLIDDAAGRVDHFRVRSSEQEQKLRELRQEHESELEGEKRIEIEVARLQGEVDALVASAKDRYDLILDDPNFAANNAEILTAEITQESIQELRDKIERLGPVNLMAIEEFEQENARLDMMHTQREDLLKAKKTIEETIARINETAQAQFLHTFESVRAHFQRLFQEFFPAGEADLILSGHDLLDADITLWANPSGKRLKSLSLMSGGEKTMTAIALLFALYQVKPSPFCVFDEVDAPLDDSNIDRFNRVIRMHADTTQFILVTHNRRTMEIADNLYGVTMEEEGISKLVSVRLLTAVA